jgi:2-C-methyl-D-erythritol 4-phosphate cytidylyltransferase
MKPGVIGIVPAAGLGKRLGDPERKQFVRIAGVPLLLHTLKRLHESEYISEIIPVLRKDDLQRGQELIGSGTMEKIRRCAPGGEQRQDSVFNALKLVHEDCLVLIHDGARPLVSHGLIEKLMQEIDGVDGVVPGMRVNETLKKVDSEDAVLSTVNRENYRTIQTPQVFQLAIIKKAYEKAYQDGIYATDDAALVERIGGRVKVVPGDRVNIKVTTREDIDFVEHVLSKKDI